MKSDIGEARLRRDQRLALYSCLIYLAGMAAGFFFPRLGLFCYAGIPASYAITELLSHKEHGMGR
jgi:hypothetical protein